MTRKQAERYYHLRNTLVQYGIRSQELETLLRCERTLHRWGEEECNGTIQRDEATGIPYRWDTSDGYRLGRVPDREAGALRRALAIAEHHGLSLYHQTDPSGCFLYLLRPEDVPAGQTADACYSNGIAITID